MRDGTCRLLGLMLLLGGAALVEGCDAGDSLSPPAVARIRVEPQDGLELAPGDEYHLSAVATDEGGTLITGVSYDWSSDDISIATVDLSGLVTAIAPGA